MFLLELCSRRNSFGRLSPTVFNIPQPLTMFDNDLMFFFLGLLMLKVLISISSFAEPDVSVGVAIQKEFL